MRPVLNPLSPTFCIALALFDISNVNYRKRTRNFLKERRIERKKKVKQGYLGEETGVKTYNNCVRVIGTSSSSDII